MFSFLIRAVSYFFLIIILFSLTSCRPPLIAHLQYINKDWLASSFVGTPDPHTQNPPLGQRLVMSWALPNQLEDNTLLEFRIRFGNQEEDRGKLYLRKYYGTYVYYLLNDAYFDKKGIMSYDILITSPSGILAKMRHHLWVEKIELKLPEEKPFPLERFR